MSVSVCSATFQNTGTINCSPVMDYADKLIFVPTFSAAGVRNKISNTAVLTQATVQALIDQADPTLRWYPTPQIENMAGERAASTFETGATGRRYKAKTGVRSYSFDVMNQWGLYQSVFEQFACADMSFFIVDATGNLIGMQAATDDGYMYPIRISNDSMEAILGMPMPDKSTKITVSFEFDSREKDSLLRMFQYTALVMTADMANFEGLVPVYMTMVTNTTTAAVVDLYAVHNGVNKKVAITGLVVTNFYDVVGGASSKAYNVTDSSAIALSSVAESATVPGRYTITYGAQTSGTLASADVVRFTIVKTQLDFTAVTANTLAVS